MKVFKLCFFISLVFVLLWSCESKVSYQTLWVVNNSSEDIAVYMGKSTHSGNTEYPDTLLPAANLTKKCAKFSKYYYTYSSLELDKDTLCLFILSQDTIDKYDWETIRDEYKIIVRYDLDMHRFNKNGRTIVYPE